MSFWLKLLSSCLLPGGKHILLPGGRDIESLVCVPFNYCKLRKLFTVNCISPAHQQVHVRVDHGPSSKNFIG